MQENLLEVPASQLDNLESYLLHEKIWHRTNHAIRADTYFKTGGIVKLFIEPKDCDGLVKTIRYMIENRIEYKVIGFTTNIMLLDDVEYSVLVSSRNLRKIEVSENYFDVECGVSLQEFVRVTLVSSSPGFEGLEGIPGTIGGALVMNAGAYGYTIADNLISLEYIEQDGSVRRISADDCELKHRGSLFRKRADTTILRARFRRNVGKQHEIAIKIETYHIARHLYQEFAFPNLGSLFSVYGDFYKSALRSNRTYQAGLFLLKLVLRNPVSKWIARKRPSNRLFNIFLSKFLPDLPMNPSAKSMNILINDGVTAVEDMVCYIETVREALPSTVTLENEIVVTALYSVPPEKRDLVKRLASLAYKVKK